jgi:hypothetical protein
MLHRRLARDYETLPASSEAINKSRLRKAIEMFQARLSGDPGWRDRRLGRRIQPIVPTAPAGTRVMVFPLRPDLSIAVELPCDLRVREAQLLSPWLTSMAR